MNQTLKDISIGVASFIAAGFLKWLWDKFIRKIYLPPIERLCDLEFIDKDRQNKPFYTRTLNMYPDNKPQNISVYLSSKNIKDIDNLNIRFGVKITIFSRLRDIYMRRLNTYRLTKAPSPNWWIDLRTQLVKPKKFQPHINAINGIYLFHQNEVPKSITEFQCTLNDDDCNIVFNPPIQIPLGHPQGSTLKIDLELSANYDWRGIVRFMSRIKGMNQYVMKKVTISSRYIYLNG
jgi:hypothetical protein